jgi:hypothetical protein
MNALIAMIGVMMALPIVTILGIVLFNLTTLITGV